MDGKLFPLFLSVLSPKKNSAVFKKIAKPAFDFGFWVLYFVVTTFPSFVLSATR